MLDAACAIPVETGLARCSIEAVAARAGVARTTIHHGWSSRGVRANECFLAAFRPQLALVRTGSAAADFRAFVASLARALSGPAGRVAASVLAQAQADAETRRRFLEEFSEPLRHESTALLRAGVDRGEFRADLDIPRVLDAAIGAVYLRLLFGQPTDPPGPRGWPGRC